LSTQFHKLARAAAAATLAAALAAGASAAPIAINGGSSWGGWTNLGNSLTTGIWGSGPTVASGATSFNGYHTRFIYNSSVHLVTGGEGSGLAAANGDVIVGIGAQLVTANNSGSLFSSTSLGVYNVPTLKFDTNANTYTPSVLGIGNPPGAVSTSLRDGDDFNVQMSTGDSAIYKVGTFNRIGPTNFGVAALAVAFGTLFDIDANSDDSFQIFVNLNQLPPLGVAAFNDFRVVVALIDSANAGANANGVTQAVFFVSPSAAVPEPGTLALVGLAFAGLGIARRCRTA